LVGTTLCRLYIALCESLCTLSLRFPLNIDVDFLLCPKNVLDIEPRRELFPSLLIPVSESERKIAWSSILAGFVCLQMAVVILQDTRLGPTFFLPQQACDSILSKRHSTTNRFQYAATKMYDYHPVMSAPNDSESPDQSLGDCAICMDAIYIDPSLRRRTSLDGKSEWVAKGTSKRKAKGGSAGGILNAVQMGVGSATARKNYSLAPCHHLFVSFPSRCET
jgi:hypothetical protein